MNKLTRFIALLLCLVLAVFPALAEEQATAFSFTAAFSMDADSFDENPKISGGIADLLNILTVEGTFDACGDSFDLNADLLLDHSEDTRTSFRLYGCESHWGIESSLLGSESAFLNMMALVEFSMKAFFYLDMPLQYVALCVSPYPTKDAFAFVQPQWEALFGGDGSRVIDREAIMDLAVYIGENAADDRAFYYWVQGLALESGYDEVIQEELAACEDWVDGFVAEEGIVITTGENGAEKWTTGDLTLFETDGRNFTLYLPETVDGFIVHVTGSHSDDRFQITIKVTDYLEADIFTASAELTGIPSSILSDFNMTADFAMSGEAVGEEKHASFVATNNQNHYNISWLNNESKQAKLSIEGDLTAIESKHPFYTQDTVTGINLLSVNDESLPEFVNNVKAPFTSGMMPILLHMPASSYQSLFTLLNQYGVIALLTSGIQ